ncbi:MAG: hypothetical protein ACP5US_02925 [Candidatus Kryptoniota bacterium]
MARKIKGMRKTERRRAKVPTEMPLKPANYKIIAAGAILIAATYTLLALNNSVYGFIPLYLVPILLFIGYLIVVPFGILYRPRKTGLTQEQQK